MCRHRDRGSSAPRGAGTTSAIVRSHSKRLRTRTSRSRAVQRCRRPTPVLGTSVTEHRRSCGPGAIPRCAKRDEGHRGLSWFASRPRTMGRRSERSPRAMVASGGVLYEHRRDENRIGPTETLVNLNCSDVRSGCSISRPFDDGCALGSLGLLDAYGRKSADRIVH